VFCERGAFGPDEAATILRAGSQHGLIPRVHANQLGPGPGVQVAVAAGAASADHCTYTTDADVDALAAANGQTVATLLPGVEFSTRHPYPDARRLIDAGVTVALATDCNPGSCFTSSMALCIALAVTQMHMTTSEAVWAATAGGARALRRTDVGHLALGARADLTLLDAPSHAYLAYRPGVPLVAAVWRNGELAAGSPR
jgi:imidazolonepropionase